MIVRYFFDGRWWDVHLNNCKEFKILTRNNDYLISYDTKSGIHVRAITNKVEFINENLSY